MVSSTALYSANLKNKCVHNNVISTASSTTTSQLLHCFFAFILPFPCLIFSHSITAEGAKYAEKGLPIVLADLFMLWDDTCHKHFLIFG